MDRLKNKKQSAELCISTKIIVNTTDDGEQGS